MANTLLTISDIKRELLMRFENNTVMAKHVLRNVDQDFAVKGRKIGDSISCRVPPRFTAVAGEGLSVQDVVEESQTITLDKFFHVGFDFSNVDLALSVDDFGQRYLESAAQALSNQIDKDIAGLYIQCPNFNGTPATTPATNAVWLQGGAILSELGCPKGNMRYAVLDPNAMATMVGANAGGGSFFHPSDEITKQYRDGMMGRAFGFGWSEDQNINSHTIGALGSTPLIKGAGQTGASIATDGWDASQANTLLQGDIVTFALCNAVNPLTGDDTGRLRQFVITADVDSDSVGANEATLPIDPPITITGARKTCTLSPANDAVILIFGHASSHADVVSPQNLIFHRDWAILAMAKQEDPNGTDMVGSMADKKSGIAFQIIRDYDINTNRTICRVNVLYGVKQLNRDFACRIVG
jgi:hypothetical protein